MLHTVETRNRVARELQAREKEKKEQELRELAMRARAERGGAGAYAPPPAAARYPTFQHRNCDKRQLPLSLTCCPPAVWTAIL